MSELKPCPFCNGSQEATQDSRGKWRGSHECDFVDPSAWFDTYEEFKEAWNARCERTDSLEQWARDMLIFLDNDEGVFCEHCVGNGEGCYGEYLCATMAEARNNFLVRLKALGVVR